MERRMKGEVRAEMRRLVKRPGARAHELAALWLELLDAPRERRERAQPAERPELRGAGVQSF